MVSIWRLGVGGGGGGHKQVRCTHAHKLLMNIFSNQNPTESNPNTKEVILIKEKVSSIAFLCLYRPNIICIQLFISSYLSLSLALFPKTKAFNWGICIITLSSSVSVRSQTEGEQGKRWDGVKFCSQETDLQSHQSSSVSLFMWVRSFSFTFRAPRRYCTLQALHQHC